MRRPSRLLWSAALWRIAAPFAIARGPHFGEQALAKGIGSLLQREVNVSSYDADNNGKTMLASEGLAVRAVLNETGGGGTRTASTNPDLVAFVYSIVGGTMTGIFPVPIKAPSVLKAQVHPVVFQCYKSFWACVGGWICVLIRAMSQKEPILQLSWLGVMSAAFWLPAGMTVILAVPIVGIGLAMTIVSGTSAVCSFLVFWFVFGEKMKLHGAYDHGFYLAPVFLVGIVVGMCALASATIVPSSARVSGPAEPEQKLSTAVFGVFACIFAGVCAAVQFGVVNGGKRLQWAAVGCEDDLTACPIEVAERFNVFGSWTASFGTSALCMNLVLVLALWSFQRCQGKPLAPLHWRVLLIPGNLAGIFWTCGNFFQLAAISRGGSAVMMPANSATSLIAAGLVSLFYYREIDGLLRQCLWTLAAVWTLSMIVLLSREKEVGGA